MTDWDLRIDGFGIYELTVLVVLNRQPWVIVNTLVRLGIFFRFILFWCHRVGVHVILTRRRV